MTLSTISSILEFIPSVNSVYVLSQRLAAWLFHTVDMDEFCPVLFILAGSDHKSRGDNVVRMWVKLKRCCVLQRGNSSDNNNNVFI